MSLRAVFWLLMKGVAATGIVCLAAYWFTGYVLFKGPEAFAAFGFLFVAAPCLIVGSLAFLFHPGRK